MEFGNPIVGQEELIREAIRSKNFASSENGVTGWRIARDGAATFYNLTVGNDAYFIDENGNGSFQSISTNGLTINGLDVQQMLMNMSNGVLAISTAPNDSNAFSSSPVIFNRLTIPNFDTTRQYRIVCNGWIDKQTSTPSYFNLYVKYSFGGKATISSPNLYQMQYGTGSGNGNDESFVIEHTFNNTDPANEGVDLSLAFCLTSQTAGARYQGTSWGRAWAEDMGPAIPYGSYDPSTDAAPTQQYVTTWSANESACYASDGTNRSGYDSGHLFQGYYSSTNGNQFSFVGFDDADIRAKLSGATINKVEVYLQNLHWYSNSGGTVYIGTHNQTTLSGNHSPSQILNDRISSSSFSYGQGKWFTVSNTIGENLKSNSAKGIAIGQAPSNSQSYYGYFAGNGQTGEPRIRITYTK